MAEGFVWDVSSQILGQLGSPALHEIGLLWGVEHEAEKLKNTISAIKAVLLDAEEKRTTDHEVRDWLEKLELAVYEVDDLLDEFYTEGSRRKVMTQNRSCEKVRIFFSRSNQLVFRRKMGHKVRRIRGKLDAIAADRLKFHLTERQQAIRVDQNRRREETQPFVRVDNVYGRDEDKKAIIDLLSKSNIEDNVSVVPIVGIGGIGKTTLAQLIFNDEDFQEHFDLHIWVHVSNVFDVKKIAQDIIEYQVGKKPERNNLITLAQHIQGKKYFLVLDDVWIEDPNLWSQLREVLMCGVKGSRVLLTTRTQLVAKVLGTVSPYFLGGLSESHSWDLFRHLAFENGKEPKDPTLEAIGKEIVNKCLGVPLAISTVGRLLHIKDTRKEWLYFKGTELSMITPSILPTLRLSYDSLPPHLKRCFTYCSLFPKDHRIDKQTLIKLWIAQGFIQLSGERQYLENVGHQYFMDLFRRSFFRDDEMDCSGDVKSCKMHGLIHDLAQFIVGSEICAIGLDAKDVIERTRHVSIGIVVDSPWEIPTRLLEALLLPIQPRKLNLEHMKESSKCNRTISGLKCLRVLDLHGLGIENVPRSIGKLRRLRYLDLSNNRFELLPKFICTLQNLQTLRLNGCECLKELPRDITDLVSLRHLEIDGCRNLSHMPRGLGQLTSLRTLTRFVVDDKSTTRFSAGLGELKNLVNLQGELSIEGLRGSIAETTEEGSNDHYLVGLEFLESLSLSWEINASGESLFESLQPHQNLKMLKIDRFGGEHLPTWCGSLPNLVQISLSDCDGCKHLSSFGLLPYLKVLDLRFMKSLEYIYREEDSSSTAQGLFPSLQKLHLEKLDQLRGLGSRKREEVVPTATAASSSSAGKELMSTSSYGKTRHLPVLEVLYVATCPLLDLSSDDLNDICLTSVSIIEMPELESLPPWLQSVTTLHSLQIVSCSKLRALPEWISELASLQKLQISKCESLESLPAGMRHLTALQELIVVGCSQELHNRCLKGTGEYWPYIKHIGQISLGEGIPDVNLEEVEVEEGEIRPSA